MIWSSNAFESMANILEANSPDLLIVTTIRSDEKSIGDEIRKKYSIDRKNGLNIPARDLVRLNFKHLHPKSEYLKWGVRDHCADWPHHIYFMQNEHNAAVVGFHSHPLAIKMRQNLVMENSTLDAEFLDKSCSDLDRIFVVDDSDVMHGCEISHRDKVCWSLIPGALDLNNIWGWAEHHASPIHRRVMETIVKVHSDELVEGQWDHVIDTAKYFIGEIDKRLSIETKDLNEFQTHIVESRTRRLLLMSGKTSDEFANFNYRIKQTIHAAVAANLSVTEKHLALAVETSVKSDLVALGRDQNIEPQVFQNGEPKYKKRPAKVITAVWGNDYLKTYLAVSLPSLISPSNIPALAEYFDLEIDLIVEQSGEEMIKNSKIFEHLEKICSVNFVLFASSVDADKYVQTEKIQQASIEDAVKRQIPFLILSPDVIFSDGTFLNIGELSRAGTRVVSMCSIRLNKQQFLRRLDDTAPWLGSRLILSGRELAALALKCLHPFTKTLFFNASTPTTWCHDVFWQVDPQYVIARGFHLVPIFIDAEQFPNSVGATFDIVYPLMSNSDLQKYHVVQDTDLGMMCELSVGTAMADSPRLPKAMTAGSIAEFAERNANEVHLNNFRWPIRIHSRPLGNDDYFVDPSKSVVTEVMSLVGRSWRSVISKSKKYQSSHLTIQNRVFNIMFSDKCGLKCRVQKPMFFDALVKLNTSNSRAKAWFEFSDRYRFIATAIKKNIS